MQREVDFIKFNPTQNMTILVKTDHPTEEYKHIAATLMAYDHVYAEQVGFIEKPRKRGTAAYLQMAGGEFCGNACLALAALVASENGLTGNGSTEIRLETSGIEHFVSCQVTRRQEGYACQLAMPIPNKIEQKTVMFEGDELNLVFVRYSEFFHIVIEVDQFDQQVRTKAQALAKLLGVTIGANLIGILLYKPHSSEMAPLIYVPSLDSMVWERGCGSGTASLGAYLSWKNHAAIAEPIKQPGGMIHVNAAWENEQVTALAIEATVEIVARGKAFIAV
ncbi:diaminopimelate epimerase [Paenibacillus sp. MMS18-CY102]|uniref:diaminopimelate epimerase n=1 Tax=Paenibacillus sp. MMS18-CY102 TaxID=2682849 RepID=UPI0013656BC9|nr:diaminopimelate epimerase [Paenibacillus sp. MMS18-CY102]MWC28117.1 diaminopimelate epimerase [Paenibacillus sp. MMS18-CY102]